MSQTAAVSAPPFRTSVSLLLRTSPFLLFNAVIYGGFFLAFCVWLAVFGGLAVLFADRVELLALIFMVVAIAGPVALLSLGKRYILYLIKGAHIAVVTRLLLHGEVPDGRGQVEYGRDVVKERFRDVSILFVLDRMVDRTLRRFTNRFVRVVDWLPLGGGATKAARMLGTIVQRSLTYVDEAILSYAIAQESENVWKSARHGLILYAQAYQPVLITAIKVWLLGRVAFFGFLLLVGIPAVFLLMAINAIWFQLVVIFGCFLLASLFVRAVFEPFAATYTIVTYHTAIAGLEVNPEWDSRLQSVSTEFQRLTKRATEFATRRGAAGAGGVAG